MDKKLHDLSVEELIDKMDQIVEKLDFLMVKMADINDDIESILLQDEYSDLAEELDYCQYLLLNKGFTAPKRLMATYL